MNRLIIPPVQTTSLTPLECDFCSAIRQDLLFFAAGAFRYAVMRNTVDAHAGAWGACEACAPFLTARDVQGMIKRVNPKTLTSIMYATGLMTGLARAILTESPPVLTKVRLIPVNGQWVEFHGDQPDTKTPNPYATSN